VCNFVGLHNGIGEEKDYGKWKEGEVVSLWLLDAGAICTVSDAHEAWPMATSSDSVHWLLLQDAITVTISDCTVAVRSIVKQVMCCCQLRYVV